MTKKIDPKDISRKQFKKLPKTDLHVHLDGSVPPQLVVQLAEEQKINLVEVSRNLGIGQLETGSVEELERQIFKDTYNSLGEYLVPFEFINEVLRCYEGLKKAAYKLASDNYREGVRYFEVRFAPQKHWVSGFEWLDIIRAVEDGCKQAADEFNKQSPILDGKEPPYKFGMILCAMRMINEHMGDYYRSLYELHVGMDLQNLSAMASLEVAKLTHMAREEGLSVVGFDLAGREDGFPAETHVKAYKFCYDRGIGTTCHAGEAYGPESIKSAVKDCNARRIGHGTQLFSTRNILSKRNPQGDKLSNEESHDYVQDIVEWIAENRIALEVCLKSNSQTLPMYRDLSKHPFQKFLDQRIRIALSTDNRAISRVSVTDEYERAVKLFNIDENALRNLCVGGFKASFFPGSYMQKRAYISKVIDYYHNTMTCIKEEVS
ncbi:MAG: adenosine deaminase family protein [bacterium]|nr:adenosine deaminase family protein [bacterium]